MDFFPTFVHAAGGSTQTDSRLEGLDLMPLFKGADKLDRDALYWHFPHNRVEVSLYMGGTILEGDWKYYRGYGLIPNKLFNIKDDPMEKKSVLKANQPLAKRLDAKLGTWLTNVSAKMPKPASR